MRSVVYERFGTPAEVLRLEERPLPVPGPGEVRVRLRLSAIHNHDLMTIRGLYGYKPPLPAVPGTEAVGVVDAVGDGVTALSVGQRVCGGGAGMWSEYFLAPAHGLIAVPDSIPDETACQLVAMPLSAWRLFEEMAVQPGDWIIQNDANGAVGKVLARRATERGVGIVNLVRRDAAVAELAAEGIGNAVSTASPDWRAQVEAITGGKPIVRALDSVGGEATDQLLSVVGEGATIYFFGSLSGERLALTPGPLIFKRAILRGFWAASPSEILSREQVGALVGEIVRRAAEGSLRLPVAEIFELADAGRACAASDVPGRPGKIALRG